MDWENLQNKDFLGNIFEMASLPKPHLKKIKKILFSSMEDWDTEEDYDCRKQSTVTCATFFEQEQKNYYRNSPQFKNKSQNTRVKKKLQISFYKAFFGPILSKWANFNLQGGKKRANFDPRGW